MCGLLCSFLFNDVLSSKAWTEKAKGRAAKDLTEDKKRKRPTATEDEEKKNQEQKAEDSNLSKKTKTSGQSTNARLSAFAFKQS